MAGDGNCTKVDVEVNFKDVYGVREFLSSKSNRVLAIQSFDDDSEFVKLRLDNIIKQIKTAQINEINYENVRIELDHLDIETANNMCPTSATVGSGKPPSFFLSDEPVFLKWNMLRDFLKRRKQEKTSVSNEFGKLTIIEVSETRNSLLSDYSELLEALFFIINEEPLKKIILQSPLDIKEYCAKFIDVFSPEFLAVKSSSCFCFQDLEEQTQTELFEANFISYKDKTISLKEFLGTDNISDSRLSDIVDAEILKGIIENGGIFVEKIDTITNPFNSESNFHINRKFSKKVEINSKELHKLVKLVREALIPDLFLFGDIKDKKIFNVKNIDTSENIAIFENFEDANTKFQTDSLKRPVHLIRCLSDGSILWVSSKGFLRNVRKLMTLFNALTIEENELINNNIVILSGLPRVGKSTTLTNIGNSLSLTSTWVISIDLALCQSQIKLLSESTKSSLVKSDVVNFLHGLLSQDPSNHPLTKALLKDALFGQDSKPVCLLFDGFDKMVENDKARLKSFIEMLEYLHKNSKVSIMIASLPENSYDLEEALCTFRTEFLDFEFEVLKEYLCKLWDKTTLTGNEKGLLLKCIDSFLESIIHFQNRNTRVSVPALLAILADASKSPEAYFSNYSNVLNISNIYKSLEDREMKKNSSTFQVILATSISEYFPESADIFKIMNFNFGNAGVQKSQKRLPFDNGLVDYVIADTLVKLFSSQPVRVNMEDFVNLMMSHVLLEPNYSTIRLFMNNLCKDTVNRLPEGFIDNLVKLLNKGKNVFRNVQDEWALYILVKEGLFELMNMFLDEEFLRRLWMLFSRPDKKGETVLSLLIKHNGEKYIKRMFVVTIPKWRMCLEELIKLTLLRQLRDEKNILEKCPIFSIIHEFDPKLKDKILKLQTLSDSCFDLCRDGNLKELKKVFNKGESESEKRFIIDKPHSDKSTFTTMLHIAAENGHLDVVKFLTNENAVAVRLLDKDCATPLFYAASRGHFEIVKFLILEGADAHVKDKYSRTVLLISAKRGFKSIVEYLLIFIKKTKTKELLEVSDRHGISPLEHAAKKGHMDVVRLLLENGCDINHRDRFGWNALAWAVRYDRFEVATFLISQGADWDILDHHGMNLVYIAVKAQAWNIVRYLTFCCIDVNVPDFNGVTPLQRTINAGKWDMVEYLISEGAKIEQNRETGFDPIGIALKNKKIHIVKFMVERGGEVNHLTSEEQRKILDEIISSEADTRDNIKKLMEAGNVTLIDLFIRQKGLYDKEKAEELEAYLAEGYQEFVTIWKVCLSKKMQIFIESALVDLRGRRQLKHLLDSEIQKRLQLIRAEIKIIEKDLAEVNLVKDNNEFLSRSIFICKQIHMIKNHKYSKNLKLPFEEIEFNLTMFIRFFLKPEHDDHCYRLILDQDTIVESLSAFANEIDKPGTASFEKLKDNYRIVRDIYFLTRISTYVSNALSITGISKDLKPFALLRCLQVIGESLKNSKTSPNLSDDIHEYLFHAAPEGVKTICTSLRDSLSHYHTLRAKTKLEENLRDDEMYFSSVQNDLKKIKPEIDFILSKRKKDAVERFLMKYEEYQGKQGPVHNLLRYIDWIAGQELNIEPYQQSEEVKEIKILIETLRKILHRDVNGTKLVNSLGQEIDIIEQIRIEPLNLYQTIYSKCFNKFENLNCQISLFNLPKEFFIKKKNIKYVKALNFIEQLEIMFKTNVTYYQLIRICIKLRYLINFEVNKVKKLEDLRMHLHDTSTQNKFYVIECSFNTIEEMLESQDKKTFQDYIKDKKLIYNTIQQIRQDMGHGKKILHSSNIEDNMKNRMLKIIDDKQTFNSFVGKVDLLSRLQKSVERNCFYEELKEFFTGIKKTCIKNTVQQYIENEEEELRKIEHEKYSILWKAIENDENNIFKNSFLCLAVEMLLLDVSDALITKHVLPDYSSSFDDSAPILINKGLRNYLAHGSILIDTLPFDPRKSILSAIRFYNTNCSILFKKSDHSKPFTQEYSLNASKLESNLPRFGENISNDLITKGINRTSIDVIKTDDVKRFTELKVINKFPCMYDCCIFAAAANAVNIFKHILDKIISQSGTIHIDIFLPAIIHAAMGSFEKILQTIIQYAKLTSVQNPSLKYLELINRLIAKKLMLIKCRKIYIGNMMDPIITPYEKLTVLRTLALNLAIKMSSIDFSRLLFEHYCNIPVRSTLMLSAAIKNENQDLVKEILNKNPNIRKRKLNIESEYRDVLRLAVANGNLNILRLLLDWLKRNKILIFDNENLLICAFYGHADICKKLLKVKVVTNINYTDDVKNTALHIAAFTGYDQVIKVLLQCRANVNVFNIFNQSPLFLAIANGNKTAIELLIKNNRYINKPENILGLTPLLQASHQGRADIIKILLQSGADINTLTKDKNSALHLAVLSENDEAVELLLSKSYNRDVVNSNFHAPLHIAARLGNNNIINLLLRHGADVNSMNQNKITPLHVAADAGHDEIVQTLLTHKANIDSLSVDGFSALHFAAQNGNDTTVDVLLAFNADVYVTSAKNNSTALHIAVIHGNEKTVKLLIPKYKDANIAQKHGGTPLHEAARYGHLGIVKFLRTKYNINIKDNELFTPLHLAAFNGHKLVIKELIDMGADIDIAAKAGATPLYLAIFNQHEDAVKMLLDHGAKVQIGEDMHNNLFFLGIWNCYYKILQLLISNRKNCVNDFYNNATLLHWAVAYGDAKCCKVLLDNGAEVNIFSQDSLQLTPLHIAVYHNKKEIVTLLLNNIAQYDAINEKHQTALHIASVIGDRDIAKILLEKGAKINRQDRMGMTPLHYSVQHGHHSILTLLLSFHADLCAPNVEKYSPLHTAAKNGHYKIVKTLLSHEAPFDQKGPNEMTPLHIACLCNHKPVVELLIHYKADVNAVDENSNTPLYYATQKGYSEIESILFKNGGLQLRNKD